MGAAMMRERVYLDWNASAPLRPEARAAMLGALDQLGNPSSVHQEGRAARAIVETARARVAALVGCKPSAIVFTSGATEAAAMALGNSKAIAWPSDHDSITAYAVTDGMRLGHDGRALMPAMPSPQGGGTAFDTAFDDVDAVDDVDIAGADTATLSHASGETGVIQPVEDFLAFAASSRPRLRSVCDISQTFGRISLDLGEKPLAASGLDLAICSAHKLGGPKGVGALVVLGDYRPPALLRGGGQESGHRSGTENVAGIAGFGAAAEAAWRELDEGAWARVAVLRDLLEERLESAAPDIIFMSKEAPRLPNTSCFALPGWPGETQVMQMDLGGFAVSAGSACSSGKVRRASPVLLAMGFDESTASSAIRVSIGPTTTEDQVMAFADTWISRYHRRGERAA